MWIFKRIGLFLLTNIAVIFLFSVIVFLIEIIFWISIRDMAGQGYMGLLIYAAMFGFIGSFFSLSISRWSAKRAYWIVPFSAEDISELSGKEALVYNTVVEIAERHNITMPEVGIYQSQDPNAFATWPSKNKSLVAVSTGLLAHMNEREIEWVVAHEMAHILNGDMVTMTLLQWVMNTFVIFFARIIADIVNSRTDGKLWAFGYFAVYMILQIILWIFASLIVNKFSRWREFHADAGSARYVGKEKMIAALESLKKLQNLAPKDTGNKMATMKISTRNSGGLKKLFMTHPPLEERIRYLEDLRIH